MASLRDPVVRDLLGGRPRRWPFVLAGAAAALIVVGLTALVVVLVADAAGEPDRQARVETSTAPTPESRPTAAAPVPRRGVLDLPQPTGYVHGVPVGYPRTVPGAVAAAYGYSRRATGLNVDETLRAIEVMADPTAGWFEHQRSDLADSVVSQREGLGLAPVGPTGSAMVSTTPAGYQIRGQPTQTSVTVLTLNIASTVAANGERTSDVIVLRWPLRWDGSRWRVTELYVNRADEKYKATPLTSEASAKGWKVARGG